MPIFYIYSPSDFVGGLPDEQGSAAAGSAPFTLTLAANAQPTLIEVSDNDIYVDEIDGSQTLTNDVTIDGVFYPAGTTFNAAYDLINSGSGHKVTSIHFGGDGYEQGPVAGIITTVPIEAGQSYTFDTERTSYLQDNRYSQYVACFCEDTRILTQTGQRKIQNLKLGELVMTRDNGPQPLRALLKTTLPHAALVKNPDLRPVKIVKGALGADLPVQDLRVSPQHRMLIVSPIANRMFETEEVLVAAKKLTNLPGVRLCHAPQDVTYYHLLFDRHEVVFAEGAPTESFYCGPQGLQALSPEGRAELEALFPEIMESAEPPEQARTVPSSKSQTELAKRHRRNRKSVLASYE